MNDTPDQVQRRVAAHHRAQSATERWLAASSLFETARALALASLPDGLADDERRLAVARRF